jgi:CD109 antigen
MWLTAFVAKSFQKARQFIYVDEETILKAINWMIGRQNADGSFPEPGRVIHKEMLGGGASSTVTLTAYVLASLSEVSLRSTDVAPRLQQAKSKAIAYLENNVDGLTDPYSLSLLSYSLYKAGSAKVDMVLNKLDSKSRQEAGMQYWEQPTPTPAANTKAWKPPHRQGKAVNIELAAYAILVKTERTGIVSALPTVRWLSSQRNANGGFSSTQDTVMGLQALSSFAGLALTSTDMDVSVTAGDNSYSYSVDSTNNLILQTRQLSPDVKTVRIAASGKGIA